MILLSAIAVGTTSLLLAYCLPTASMQDHMRDSSIVFLNEGTYPVASLACSRVLDNFTDSKMLLTAAYPGSEPVVEKAMMGYSHRVVGVDPVESLIVEYGDDASSMDDRQMSTTAYSRYWQGYLVILKPLLMLFDYQAIRYVNCVMLVLLTIAVAVMLWRRLSLIHVIAFALTAICLAPLAVVQSLQYSSIAYISLLAMLAVMVLWEKVRSSYLSLGMLFFLVGIVTSYFDFLTYPVVALGFPLITYLVMAQEPPRQAFPKAIYASFIWLLGYGCFWASKWLVAVLIMGDVGIVEDAIGQAAVRSALNAGLNDQSLPELGLLDGLIVNIQVFFDCAINDVIVCIGCAACLIGLVTAWRRRRYRLSSIAPLVFVAFLPLLWYLGMGNHSVAHSFFTFRDLSVSVYALLAITAVLLKSSFGTPPEQEDSVDAVGVSCRSAKTHRRLHQGGQW